MKIKHNFALREIAGEYVLIPMGESALNFGGLISTNELGAFLWNCLKEETSREQLLARILEEYDVDRETAERDLDKFLEQARKHDLIVE